MFNINIKLLLLVAVFFIINTFSSVAIPLLDNVPKRITKDAFEDHILNNVNDNQQVWIESLYIENNNIYKFRNDLKPETITHYREILDSIHYGFKVRIADTLNAYEINPYLVIFVIATLPIIELRGAIPVGITFFNLNWFLVIIVSILGNMLPIFFVLFLFKYVEKVLRYIPFMNSLMDFIFSKTMAKNATIEKYEELGLMFFVGVPLPITGAWTGSLLSYLMKLSYKKAIVFIFLGVLISSVIVSTFTYFGVPGLITGVSILTIITIIAIITDKQKRKKL